MSSNIVEFEHRFRELARRLPEEKIVPAQKLFTLRLLRGFVLRTPVDTGRLRFEWQVTIGAPATGPIGGVDTLQTRAPVPYSAGADPTTGPEAGSAAFNRGVRALETLKPYQVVWLTNPLPYAVVIDRGRLEGEAIGEGSRSVKVEVRRSGANLLFGSPVFGRRVGARGSLQAIHGMTGPTLEEILA